MRQLIALAAVALSACGNYSNDDISFLDALPDQQALEVNVPQSSSQALSQTATLFTGTVQTAQTINSGGTSIIAMIDLVRTLTPTSRGLDSRTWGPFPDSTPGFEDQVVVTRSSNTYNFEFDQRAVGGTFVAALTGTLVGDTATTGHGSLDLEAAPLESIGRTLSDPNLRSIRFVYANDTNPRTVNTTIALRDATNGSTSTLSYAFSQTAEEGDLDFDLQGPSDAGPYDIRVLSRWRPDGGEGRADGVGQLLDYPNLSIDIEQCWDSSFLETYYDSEAGLDAPDGGILSGAPSLGCDAAIGLPCPRGSTSTCVF